MDFAYYFSLTRNTEMSQADHALILALMDKFPCTKVLEVGVCAGGTTSLLLSHLPKTSVLHSVDIATRYPRDKTKKTGYIAEKHYNPRTQAGWKTHFGLDVAECLQEIGTGIDFVILDTVHSMPGEFLSFLAVFPFLKNNAIVVLHDINVHVIYKSTKGKDISPQEEHQYCTPLLFNAIASRAKFMSDDPIPNCGALILDKALALDNMAMVMNMLFIPWAYMPSNTILAATLRLVNAYYPEQMAALLAKAVEYNRWKLEGAC